MYEDEITDLNPNRITQKDKNSKNKKNKSEEASQIQSMISRKNHFSGRFLFLSVLNFVHCM